MPLPSRVLQYSKRVGSEKEEEEEEQEEEEKQEEQEEEEERREIKYRNQCNYKPW